MRRENRKVTHKGSREGGGWCKMPTRQKEWGLREPGKVTQNEKKKEEVGEDNKVG